MEALRDIQLVECPRDALQSHSAIVSSAHKLAYYQQLLKAGFHTIDIGSFVSPRAVPQLADTAEVIQKIDRIDSATKLLVIVANEKGAKEAVNVEQVDLLGYPLSISETFQQKNTRHSIKESLDVLEQIKDMCSRSNKSLVVYLSMAFGNPYGDSYHPELVIEMANKVLPLGVDVISLADTVGLATPTQIDVLTRSVLQLITTIPVGLHLHGESSNWQQKIEAGYLAGCRRFDGAIGGYGGCPFTGSERVGNIDTLKMNHWFSSNHIRTGVDQHQLELCAKQARQLFS